MNVIANLMQRKFSESQIDGFVYFTVNQNSFKPNSRLHWHIWTPLYRKQNDIVLGQFVNELGEKFFGDFFTTLTGIPLTAKMKIDNVEEGIKTIDFIPKDIIYMKKGSR
ncbi:MAG: hypothetical protein ACR2KZ_00055 [Segetibacter sp.]